MPPNPLEREALINRDKYQTEATKTVRPPDREQDDTVPCMVPENGSVPAADKPQTEACQENVTTGICDGEEGCASCLSCEEDVPQERPVVTLTLMALCGVAYLLQWTVPGFLETFAFAPMYTGSEPWRMLTAAFLHSPFIVHIAFNLYALWFLGRSLEPALGRLYFLLVYLVSALGGSIGVSLLAPASQAVVGASGAIFGLLGALFVIQLWGGGKVKGMLIFIGFNLVLGFLIPFIAWQAHLGGLLTGAACTLVLAYAPEGPRQSLIRFGGLAAITVALVLAGLLWAPVP